MAERVYQLDLKTPVHLGTGGIDREDTLTYIPSDTLFSALVAAWSRIDPTGVAQKLSPFLAQPPAPPFSLTSAFPFAGPVRFFPRPLRYLPNPVNLPFKRIKKANWVSEAIFRQLLTGQLPANELDETANFIQGKQIWLTRAERQTIAETLELVDRPDDRHAEIAIWQSAIAPRVTVDRLGSGSNIFHTGRVKFNPGCGLWFAARGDDFADLETGLAVLQDEGLGGLRSTGHGAFTYTLQQNQNLLPAPQTDQYFVNLARYAPADSAELQATVQQPHSAYKLTMVKGWCQDDQNHPWRRKRIRLIGEGAYLRWPGATAGKLVDLTPDTTQAAFNGRKVYRYGFAFPVGAA